MTAAPTTPRRTAAPAPADSRTQTAGRRRPRPDRVYLWFLLPTLVLFTLSITTPAAMGIFYSFTDSVGFGEFEFVGLNNYLVMFSDPAILSAYGFTIGVALATVVLVNVVALALAIGLTAKIRAKTALRTIFVMPMVVSGIIIAFVFQFIFANTVPAAAQALQLGVLEESILANPDLAWISIVLVTAWQAVPQAMLIYIAGLMTVPQDVYEASAIDGASAWKQLRSITLPLISGFVLINVIIGFKDFLGTYEIIVGLTDGGPGTSTRSVAMAIFSGFDNGDYAYQMANSTIFFLITLTIALIQLRLTRGNARI
ncbi:carbohydrate ABC transporter permease [Nesterenkonia halotolerans]|uniref:Raffinose/stachyose/melibiose transport system permease protein n=1 Tax=Nesterenkonia halotolerans TaxID=225325 RepID=A0ABR9JAI9_9MICC|nr:sugar ABC transporter permease [Nesterenkonia halotolerans]MBE1515920.1 raffinose/stachyose/melibiose transport system permease protein [Nesterenkonia halotolerans]